MSELALAPVHRVARREGLARRLLELWERTSPTASEHTRRARHGDLEALATFLEVPEGPRAHRREQVCEALIYGGQAHALEALTRWRHSMRKAGYKAATIARRLASVRSLLRTAQDVGLPWRVNVKGPTIRRGRLRAPKIERARKALDRLEARAKKARRRSREQRRAVRDRAILAVLVYCALRRAEVAQLELTDFADGADPGLTVRGKGGHVEEIGCAGYVRDALAAWIRVRGRDPGRLFCHPDGSPLTPETIANRCKAHGLGAPHRWRHAAVTELLKHGHVLAAQALARHANLSTTDGYRGRVDDLSGFGSRFLAGET